MDHLKNVSQFPFIYQRKVVIREFIKSWGTLLKDDLSLTRCTNVEERNATDLNIPLQMVKSLQKDLNPDNFCCSIEDDKSLAENLPKASNRELETLKSLSEHNERASSDSTYRMQFAPKYRHDWLNRETSVAEVPPNDHDDPPVAVLTVQIFKPAIKGQNRTRVNLDRQFEILSSQSLIALRDSFICIADVLSDRDFSLTPQEPLPNFVVHEKPGFFFIDGTFYSDSRCENVSFAKKIVDWAAERNVGQFSEKSMVQSKFEDLSIYLGFPYLYMHGNNCEHLLIFSDIRMLVRGSESSTGGFPRCTALESLQRVKCQMCALCFSKWLVQNNRRLPESPFYFCHNCFMSYNYDAHGKKIGSFQAYPIYFNLDR